MKTQELFRELKSGKVFPVYLLLGEDRGGKDAFLELLQKRVSVSDGNQYLDKSVYFGSETSTEKIVEELKTYSIFSDKKIVIVKELEKLAVSNSLFSYLSAPNEESVLVLMTDQNRAQKKIMDTVGQRGRVSIFWHMFQNESERWVIDRLRATGIEADGDAVDYIIELSGTGRSELNNQVIKISNFLGRGERLTLGGAQDIVTQLYDYTVFDLCDALFTKRARDILVIFRNLLNNGEDLGKIFFFCNREIQRLLSAWSLKQAGHDIISIERTLHLRKRDTRRIGTLMQQLSLGIFIELYRQLHVLDYTLKSSPKELAVLSFERFIAGLGRNKDGRVRIDA
jgi:DNA polymerase-3 subunit delta